MSVQIMSGKCCIKVFLHSLNCIHWTISNCRINSNSSLSFKPMEYIADVRLFIHKFSTFYFCTTYALAQGATFKIYYFWRLATQKNNSLKLCNQITSTIFHAIQVEGKYSLKWCETILIASISYNMYLTCQTVCKINNSRCPHFAGPYQTYQLNISVVWPL